MVIIVVVKRSPILKGSFNKAPKCEKSAFLGSLKYAFVREVSIFQFLAHKLACFAQSPDLVHTNKQTNKQTIDLETKGLLYPSAAHVLTG